MSAYWGQDRTQLGMGKGLPALSSGLLATAAADPCGTLPVGCKVSIGLSRTESEQMARLSCVDPFLLPQVSILRQGVRVGGVTVAPHKGDRSYVLAATITMPDHAPTK